MLNTQLIDVPSGQTMYTIFSRASYILDKDKSIVGVASRTTSIMDSCDRIIATIEWAGREKRLGGIIRIMDNEPVKFAELFGGCDSVITV